MEVLMEIDLSVLDILNVDIEPTDIDLNVLDNLLIDIQ
jgi:hypothetical protein